MLSRAEKVLSLPAVVMPDQSRISFRGSLSISKMTIAIYKSAARRGDEPLFVGICSTPLVQFYREKDTITLMRGSSYLFDNAALSAGLSAVSKGSNTIDNPSAWETVTLKLESLHSCDVCVDELLARQAEEVFAPPFSLGDLPAPVSALHSSRRDNTPSHPSHRSSVVESTDSYNSHHNQLRSTHSNNEDGNSRNMSPAHSSARRAASSSTTTSSNHTPISRRSNKPVSSHISERPERQESAVRPSSARGISSQSSQIASTVRSSRLPSRRENDDGASSAAYTPSESIRSSQRIASRRSEVEPTLSSRRDRSAERAPPSASDSHHRSSSKHRVKRPVDPMEREFREEKPRARTGSSHRRHHTPMSNTMSATPASSSRYQSSPRRVEGSRTPGEDGSMAYSNSITPRSTTLSSRQRSEQEQFFRTIQKMQHHRLHFVMYLHKEMVHQAYLVEEAKLKAAAAGGARPRASSSRRGSAHRRGNGTTDSPRSARQRTRDHSSAIAEESARLHEIEVRMAGVEALHREAEREREAAARLRREYEWKMDELAAGRGAAPGMVHSRDTSEFNSSARSPSRRGSNVGNGQVILVPEGGGRGGAVYPHSGGAQQLMPYNGYADDSHHPDMGVAIVDRYVFGDDWGRLYPSQEADIRFNAQIDVCLALKLPRDRVTITNLVVDQPGLRVTTEISHDHNKLPRSVIERRINGSPFRFLQRMYDMRDLFDSREGPFPNAIRDNGVNGSSTYAIRHRASNDTTSGGGALVTSGHNSRRPSGRGGPYHRHSDAASEDNADVEARLRALRDRQERRAKAANEALQQRQKKHAREVRKKILDRLEQLEEDEDNSRRRIKLAEATARQRLSHDLRLNQKTTLVNSLESIEEAESVARATIEVGAARQWQLLSGAHRRQLHLASVVDGEQLRRRTIAEQEAYTRATLNDTMNPKRQPSSAKGRKQRHDWMNKYNDAVQEEQISDLVLDERAARTALMTDAMSAWLEILYKAPSGRDAKRAPSVAGRSSLRQMLADLAEDEAADRRQILNDEARHRSLYRGERVLQGETVDRDRIESDELAQRSHILDRMLQQSRAALERRVSEREAMLTLINEEQFYRSTILADEQDGFEVIAELFAEGLKDLLARAPEEDPEEDMWSPRRRPTVTRQAKPFHYMTFSPEDMDYPPSAVLAIEGILGCGINKNLEVTSIARPLPKTEDETLQFQAGDMILDVAGHSLHSLSHLREVLSTRAVKIQEEAKEEFPDVPEDQLTTAPALQRYIEVLCEHHNFLVQVLRGCDIFQIIVKS